METKQVGGSSRPYADTESFYEVSGCEGRSDEEVKSFVGWKEESEVLFAQCFFKNYKRKSDGQATYTVVTPLID
ncbi:MAG: hypothetical protein WCS18_11580 [Sphaerochaetaceae bacterium]